jgi:hypothetical protein
MVPPSWTELVAALAAADTRNWIFRGQARHSWPLHSSFARQLVSARIPERLWQNSENSSIGFFKDRANAQLERPPEDNDALAWLSLMQHYRAPTRLLDWTASPFIAVYFAYASAGRDEDAALWALQAYHCRSAAMGRQFSPLPHDHLGTQPLTACRPDRGPLVTYPAVDQSRRNGENDHIRDVIRSQSFWPLPVLPFDVDLRMAAQQAVFTVQGDLKVPLDAAADKDAWPDTPGRGGVNIARPKDQVRFDALEEPWQVLKRIRLPRAWRSAALESLSRMGITAESLFPGLDGIGDATRLHIESGRLTLRDVLTDPLDFPLPADLR